MQGVESAPAFVQIAEVRFDNNGAVVALKAEGFEELLAIAIGPAEAFALYRTFGPETRRPSTLLTWQHSLDVRAHRHPYKTHSLTARDITELQKRRTRLTV